METPLGSIICTVVPGVDTQPFELEVGLLAANSVLWVVKAQEPSPRSELMSRETRSLICLEHSISKPILCGQIKVRLNRSTGVVNVAKLWIPVPECNCAAPKL